MEPVNAALRSGITALVSEEMAAALEAGYSRIRVADASEQYKTGEPDRAREMVQNVFGDFEANASEFHETLEETDERLYETFEHDHLEGLISAIENGNDDAVRTHVEGVHETLMQFEEQILPTAAVSGVEGSYLAARALDAAGVAALGNTETARTVVSDALAYFERGAAGFHDAIEQADEERYESFETGLETLEDEIGADSTTAADTAVSRAIEAVYAVIEVGGSGAEAASPLLSDIFAHFEEARVHDLVEEADQDSYEAFESALDGYIKGLEDGKRPDEYVSTYAESCLQVQFAVAGAPDEAPANPGGGEETSDDGEDTTLEGGPNVVEGVPDEADHVVDLQAVAFEPAELTIQQGETVAWRFAAGEAHNVVAYESELPVDADYWASGGFESESAAREGWENGRGAVQSGQSYVKTFETAGEYEYFCVPHEAAGMVGTIIVEG
jgi:plastocyanin